MRFAKVGCTAVAVLLAGLSLALPVEKTPSTANSHELFVGDYYEVQVTRQGVSKSLGGDLLKVTDRWIVLKRVTTEQSTHGIPYLMDIPLIGSLFRRTYNVRSDENLWIPRDAMTVTRQVKAVRRSPAMPPDGDEPPTKRACWLEVVNLEKDELLPDVEIAAIADGQFELIAVGGARHVPEHVAESEVLCVRVPNSAPAEITARNAGAANSAAASARR